MFEPSLTILQGLVDSHGDGSRYHLLVMPLSEFRWWIYLWFLAFHTVLAVILTELMSRTYGKPALWFILNFFLPLIGPVVTLWYHLIISSSISGARKETFWERVLSAKPVSLFKVFIREQARAQEITLDPPKPTNLEFRADGSDPNIDGLLEQGKYSEARAHAWKMLEIAHELKDKSRIATYQEYLEIVAEQQAINTGRELKST
jgi:hypothetical protein